MNTEPAVETKGLPTHRASCDELVNKTLDDINTMLDFARVVGKLVPEDLRAKAARLCYEPDAAQGTDKTSEVSKDETRMSLAFEVHGALSQLVAPATAETIKASQIPPGGHAPQIPTVRFLWLVSSYSLCVFLVLAAVITAVDIRSNSPTSPKTESSSTNSVPSSIGTTNYGTNRPGGGETQRQVGASAGQRVAGGDEATAFLGKIYETLLRFLYILAAASLGSAFYGLRTAHKYIVERTFDPRYDKVYRIRFLLGVTAGTILGIFGKDFFKGADTAKQLTPGLLALVGGFAAEAVSQVLQRFADTLVTLVRGSNADTLQAKQEEVKAKAKQQETLIKMEAMKPLQAAKEALLTNAGSDKVKDAIQKAIDTFSK